MARISLENAVTLTLRLRLLVYIAVPIQINQCFGICHDKIEIYVNVYMVI